MDEAHQYVVYRFPKGVPMDLEDSRNIVCITNNTFVPLNYEGGEQAYNYVVTALDRMHNESKGTKKKVKL